MLDDQIAHNDALVETYKAGIMQNIEAEHFIVEGALQMGAVIADDDATEFLFNQAQLLAFAHMVIRGTLTKLQGETQTFIDELAAKGFVTFHRDDVQELKAEAMIERHWHNASPSKAAIAATIKLANILTQDLLEEKLIKITPAACARRR